MGCCGYGYFILGHFVAGHIMRCTDKMSVDKILGDKSPVKIAREDKMLCIYRHCVCALFNIGFVYMCLHLKQGSY